MAFFAIVFSLISIVNHYNFRTHALDYGMFNQALFQFSIGENAQFTQGIVGEEVNYLCDHFSPVIILLSPLRFVLGTYTLLLVQIFAVLINAYFLYRIALEKELGETKALLVAALGLSMWPVFAALSYDFHTNVIAACLLPGMYFFLLKRFYVYLAGCTLLALLCKENSGILLSAFYLVVSFDNSFPSSLRRKLVVASFFCFALLVITLSWVMPAMCEGGHSNSEGFYNHFGTSYSIAALNILSHPFDVLKLFFWNFDGELAKSKITTYIFLFLSGGVFVLIQPRFLILLVAVLAQKVLSSNELLWDIHGQYSIEFVPIVGLALVSFLHRFKTVPVTFHFLVLTLGLALFMSWRGPISRNEQSNLFAEKHYQSEINRSEFDEIKVLIDPNSFISCTSSLTPHLSFREIVYVFPIIKNAEVVLIEKHPKNTYPQTVLEFENSLLSIMNDSLFVLKHETDHLMLFSSKEYQTATK